MDAIELSLERSLDYCIKCNICSSNCPVSAVTDKFPGPKYVGPQAQRFRHERQESPDESVDYCSGCRVCNEVCPTGVKIYELNARARARIYEEQGIPLRNHLLARSELLGKLACGPQAYLANFGLGNAPLRWIGEKLMGVAQKAPVPPFSPYSLRSWFKRRSNTQPFKRSSPPFQVVYYHGCATNYYEPRVGKAAIEVLERNGFEVILAKQNCCGLPLISNGAFDAARQYHASNVEHLATYARQSIPIVGTSTSCTLTLKEEAPEILAMHGEDVELVAQNTYDIFEFLRNLHERGELNTDFVPVNRTLPYHPPCQYRAHRLGRPAMDVLELIPGLRLVESQAACCGIAGTYGFKAEKYEIGMQVGAPLFEFVRQSGSDLALCDSETCRWQISHATGVATQHPIEIVRLAYG